MQYKIDWLEVKSPEWKMISITNEAGISYTDVSLNKRDKKGTEFPNFDNLKAGDTIHGEYWETSDKSKRYLYPPRPQSTNGGPIRRQPGASAMAIKEAQETKAKNIAQAQDRAAWMWAKNNASQLLSAKTELDGISMNDIAGEVIKLATKIYNGEPTEPFN